MKKNLLILLCFFIVLCLFSACDLIAINHQHNFKQEWSFDATKHWRDCDNTSCKENADVGGHSGGTATCTQKATCSTCGCEYGELASHTGGTATCSQLATCTVCNQQYGQLTAHTGGTATCESKAICTICGDEYGELQEHKWTLGLGDSTSHSIYCTVCQATQTDNHYGGTATCSKQAICELCAREYGDLLSHTGGTATCSQLATCTVCNQQYGQLTAHTGGTATCVEQAICQACQTPYGSFASHVGGSATCANQAICQACNKPYGALSTNHNWSSNWSFDAVNHWKTCQNDGCTAKFGYASHSGGTATTTQKATCSVCSQPYGDIVKRLVNIKDYDIMATRNETDGANTEGSNAIFYLRRQLLTAYGFGSDAYNNSQYSSYNQHVADSWYGGNKKLIIVGCVDVGSKVTQAMSDFSKQLRIQAQALGGDSFIIKADENNNIYLVGASFTADRYAIAHFLSMYFGYEVLGTDNSYIEIVDYDTFTFDIGELLEGIVEEPSIAIRTNGLYQIAQTSGGSWKDDTFGMRLASSGSEKFMYLIDGSANAMQHNSLTWLPYETYGESYSNWYTTNENNRELCYTAHGNSADYEAMLNTALSRAKTFLAISDNDQKPYLMFGKQDTSPICQCSACVQMKNTYGSASATVVKFMNDLMAKIEADDEITRKDFKLAFFAYEDFETAPTGITLNSRVIPLFAAAYSFNYQASINDATNDNGRATLTSWANISSEVLLWTYSTRFNNYMYPVDTFKFYNEDAYEFFRANKVSMLINQNQSHQTGASTAWNELKLYVESILAWDTSKSQAQLISHYMEKSYGPAASIMTNFLNSVRTACANEALMNAYRDSKDGAWCLLGNGVRLDETTKKYLWSTKESKYWDKTTVESWLTYCEQAYDAIASLETTDPVAYARYKRNIDKEWVSPAYMRVNLWGESTSFTHQVTKDNLLAVCNSLGMTVYRENAGTTEDVKLSVKIPKL